MSLWQRVHILDELGRHGVEFIEFNPKDYRTEDERAVALFKLINLNKIDLFFTVYSSQYVSKAILSHLKKMGIPSLLFCPDNLLVPFEHLSIAPYFDLVWLTAGETEYLFKGVKSQTIFLPYAANPHIYRGIVGEPINRALFVGNAYGSRANMINALTANQIDTDLYSGELVSGVKRNHVPHLKYKIHQTKILLDMMRFSIGKKILLGALKQKILGTGGIKDSPYIHRYPGLSFDDMYRAYARYSLSLTSTAARNTGVLRNPVNVINLRSFEVPMAGGVQFCAYSKELANYFEEDREIIFYRTEDEMIDKARFYTSENAAKDITTIRDNARNRALRDHSWGNRFNEVFSILGLKRKGFVGFNKGTN